MPELPRLVLADDARRAVGVVGALVIITISTLGLWAGIDHLITAWRGRA